MEKTFLKGLHLLEALALSEEPRGVTELGRELGLTKSNVHRLLQTLAHRGFVRQDATTDRYHCTLKLWELGSLVAERVELPKVARPYLSMLAGETHETVHLSVLEDNEVLYIDKIDSPMPVRAYSRIGGRAPAYCVATGKAMLAYLPESQLEGLLGELTRYSPRTITSSEDLLADLRKTRELGYAVNRGEWRESVCGVASPVFDASRRVCAAIGVSGPAERLTPGVIRDFSPLVINAAQQISRALGFNGQPANARID